MAALGILHLSHWWCIVLCVWLGLTAWPLVLAGWEGALSACQMVFLVPAQVPLNYGSSPDQLLRKFRSSSGFATHLLPSSVQWLFTSSLRERPGSSSPCSLFPLSAGQTCLLASPDELLSQILLSQILSSRDNWLYSVTLWGCDTVSHYSTDSMELCCDVCYAELYEHCVASGVNSWGVGGTSPLGSSRRWHGNVIVLAGGL